MNIRVITLKVLSCSVLNAAARDWTRLYDSQTEFIIKKKGAVGGWMSQLPKE